MLIVFSPYWLELFYYSREEIKYKEDGHGHSLVICSSKSPDRVLNLGCFSNPQAGLTCWFKLENLVFHPLLAGSMPAFQSKENLFSFHAKASTRANWRAGTSLR
ncbi:hypothetical protein C3733_20175 [Bacillus amyloliquefaciens]|nr:hypothetical protein C3733_20175 [Bacillus amyloliquefaciens]